LDHHFGSYIKVVGLKLQWTWDNNKNQTNKRKHGLSFDAAQYVFADPLALIGRIIRARNATAYERRAYEEEKF
jgi:uncharacterized DUF497 family protein